MRTNQTITVYKKIKADGVTMFHLLFSCSAHVAGSNASKFNKGMTTSDSFTVRIPIEYITNKISTGDRIVINSIDSEALSDKELTQMKALTVTAVRINDNCSSRIAHIRLDCEK